MGRNEPASRKSVNFLEAGAEPSAGLRFLAALVLLAVAAALFSLVAVSGRLEKAAEAERELSKMQREIDRITAECSNFDVIKREYDRYSYESFDLELPDRLEVLGLLEREVFPRAEVKSFTVSGSTLSVTLLGLGLEGASELISALKDDPLVEGVTVSTASEGGVAVTKLTVSLAGAQTVTEAERNE